MKEKRWPGFLVFRKRERIRNWVLTAFIVLSFLYTWHGLGVWKDSNYRQNKQIRLIEKRLNSLEEQCMKLQVVDINQNYYMRETEKRIRSIEERSGILWDALHQDHVPQKGD